MSIDITATTREILDTVAAIESATRDHDRAVRAYANDDPNTTWADVEAKADALRQARTVAQAAIHDALATAIGGL